MSRSWATRRNAVRRAPASHRRRDDAVCDLSTGGIARKARLAVFGWLVAILVCHGSVSSTKAAEQTPESQHRHVPASMSAKEYEAMLGDIADTVVRRLRSDPGEAPAPTGSQAQSGEEGRIKPSADMFKSFGQLEDRAVDVAAYLPRLDDSLAQVLSDLGAEAPGGFGLFALKIMTPSLKATSRSFSTAPLPTALLRPFPWSDVAEQILDFSPGTDLLATIKHEERTGTSPVLASDNEVQGRRRFRLSRGEPILQ
ncbi:MAG: hypothetical protein JOZ88_01265 [Hyphomicrobiales bacterium]|nr:hypothetical protein [Hyphomicrobiales bacterium]